MCSILRRLALVAFGSWTVFSFSASPYILSDVDLNLNDAVITAPSSDTSNESSPAPWIWSLPISVSAPPQGNWGLKAIRVPQLWNLNYFIARQNRSVPVGILDAGFEDRNADGVDDHSDLQNLKLIMFDEKGQSVPGANVSYHGQHVAGTIGATFNNGLGIDGVNPFAQMIGVSPRLPQGQDWQSSWVTLIETLDKLLTIHPEIRLVNVSMSYNWPINTSLKVNPNTDVNAQKLVSEHGLLARKLAAKHSNVLFIVAAGNDSPKRFGYPTEILVQWASPLNWAALGPETSTSDGTIFPRSPNILVIESFDNISPGETSYRKSDFSNVGGHLSAPGGRILSTVLKGKYETYDGTSMATPHITGLASYLLAFDPTLTVVELKELLLKNTFPIEQEKNGGRGPNGEGPAPRVDAFSAVLAIDSLREGNLVQRALVDVDDCTLDGNSGTKSNCADGRRGDGKFDMKDFRVFRDALLYVEGKYRGNIGPRDLNGDGCVHEQDPKTCPVDENVYSRFDFNGDGKISRTELVNFKGTPKTDLQVLMEIWGQGAGADTEGWLAEDLPSLLNSGDVHLDLTAWAAGLGLDEIKLIPSQGPIRIVKDTKLIVTATAFMTVQLEAQGLKNGTVVATRCARVEPLEPGQDVTVTWNQCS